jgi:hypothetical protein
MWYEADPARAERFWATLGLGSSANAPSPPPAPLAAAGPSFCSASSLAHPPTADASFSSQEPATLPGGAPRRCTPEVARAVLQQHACSPSLLAIFPLQDVFALSARLCAARRPEDECINDPTVRRHYWRYRMHLKLEDLCADAELLGLVQEVLLLGDRVSPQELQEARAGIAAAVGGGGGGAGAGGATTGGGGKAAAVAW